MVQRKEWRKKSPKPEKNWAPLPSASLSLFAPRSANAAMERTRTRKTTPRTTAETRASFIGARSVRGPQRRGDASAEEHEADDADGHDLEQVVADGEGQRLLLRHTKLQEGQRRAEFEGPDVPRRGRREGEGQVDRHEHEDAGDE